MSMMKQQLVFEMDLTDAEWDLIADELPLSHRRGGQWRDHRQVINGILWKLETGASWRSVPERYGPWQTIYDRFVRWLRDGTLDRLLRLVELSRGPDSFLPPPNQVEQG
jgi:transposase